MPYQWQQEAVEKSESLSFPVSEATVRNYKREMQKFLKGHKGQDLESIEAPTRKFGRPLLFHDEIDQLTKTFNENLCTCGSHASSTILLATAKGIVIHKDSSLLKEHGGPVEL